MQTHGRYPLCTWPSKTAESPSPLAAAWPPWALGCPATPKGTTAFTCIPVRQTKINSMFGPQELTGRTWVFCTAVGSVCNTHTWAVFAMPPFTWAGRSGAGVVTCWYATPLSRHRPAVYIHRRVADGVRVGSGTHTGYTPWWGRGCVGGHCAHCHMAPPAASS